MSACPVCQKPVDPLRSAAVAVREWPFHLRRHYRRSLYDDVLSKLADRESAEAFGRVAMKDAPGAAAAVAALLRQRLSASNLRSVALAELSQGHVFVAGGWVVPESVALICALAARES